MATKRLKPDTPSRRFNVVPTFDEITKSKPERKLTVALRKTGGRNHHGKITSRRRGGGHKRRYRLIESDLSIKINFRYYCHKITHNLLCNHRFL